MPELTPRQAILLDQYDQVKQYDVHYSTVRSSIATFLITAVFASDAWILQSTYKEELSSFSPLVIFSLIIGPLAVLLAALAISANFERLTFACAKIQKHIEQALEDDTKPIPYFRHTLKELIRKSNGQKPHAEFRWIKSDSPQIALAVLIMVQLVISLAYWEGKADLTSRLLNFLCR